MVYIPSFSATFSNVSKEPFPPVSFVEICPATNLSVTSTFLSAKLVLEILTSHDSKFLSSNETAGTTSSLNALPSASCPLTVIVASVISVSIVICSDVYSCIALVDLSE